MYVDNALAGAHDMAFESWFKFGISRMSLFTEKLFWLRFTGLLVAVDVQQIHIQTTVKTFSERPKSWLRISLSVQSRWLNETSKVKMPNGTLFLQELLLWENCGKLESKASSSTSGTSVEIKVWIFHAASEDRGLPQFQAALSDVRGCCWLQRPNARALSHRRPAAGT